MNTEAIDDGWGSWRGWFWRLRGRRISTTERALIAAQGKALAVLTTVLHAGGHVDAKRLAKTLALFSTVVSEDDELQGAILAIWADTMEESVDATGTETERK